MANTAPTLQDEKPNQTAEPTSDKLTGLRIYRAWWLAGIILLAIMAGVVGYLWLNQGNQQANDNHSGKTTQSGSQSAHPSATSSATPSATPLQNTSLNLMPISDKEVTLTPQVQGATYDREKVAVNTTTSQIRHDFAANDSEALYGLFSSDLQAMFSQQNLAAALQGVGAIDLQPVGDPVISTEWAKQTVSYIHNGTTTKYDVILHKENGEWKLFGTMAAE